MQGLVGAEEIALGMGHTCARLVSDTLECWGGNSSGQLGNGGATDQALPQAVQGLSGAMEVALGGAHTCARTIDGKVTCWGSNFYGQLGDGTTTDRYTPASFVELP